jgi:hypothetical protein
LAVLNSSVLHNNSLPLFLLKKYSIQGKLVYELILQYRFILKSTHNTNMKILGKIFFVMILLLFAGFTSLAQVKSQQKDTLMVVQKSTEANGNDKSQDIKDNNKQQSGKGENNPGSQDIKRLKAARPDMSKVRGARPPDIVRPSGSRIPRGLGKPGGANMPGKR